MRSTGGAAVGRISANTTWMIPADRPTATPIWGTLGLDDEALGKVAASVSGRLLDGHFLEAEAVADAILFMLSDQARGIHGQDLIVDNGYTLR